MIVEFEDDLNGSINIEQSDTIDQIADTLAAHPEILRLLNEAVSGAYFEGFETKDGFCTQFATRIAKAYTEDGPDGARLLIEDEFPPEDAARSEFRNNVRGELRDAFPRVTEPVADAYNELHAIDSLLGQYTANTILESLLGKLQETAIELLLEQDRSSPFDIVPSHVKVNAYYIPISNGIGVDDVNTDHDGLCFEAETALPNANFMRFLHLVNIRPSQYAKIMMDERGFDLLNPDISACRTETLAERRIKTANEWAVTLELERILEKNPDIETPEALAQISHPKKPDLSVPYYRNEWSAIADFLKLAMRNTDRTPVFSDHTLITVLDNSSYGGAPVFYFRMELLALLNGKYDKIFKATGGQCGLCNFNNGSGHVETPDAPVLVNPSDGRLRFGLWFDMEKEYGIVGSYLDIKAIPVEAPAPASAAA